MSVPAGGVEHVRPIEEARERLAVLAVADQPQSGGRRNLARYAAHMAASATKRKVDRRAYHAPSQSWPNPGSGIQVTPIP